MKTTTSLITDSQSLVSARFTHGTPIPVYDDGFGPLFILRDSMGIQGIARAQTWEDAYGIAEDEFFPEARETVEELRTEHSTVYLSGRALWEYEIAQTPAKAWKWADLTEEGKANVFARGGKDVPFLADFTEHPCFQEAYGFRPNGANTRDKLNHGIYRKDLNGEALDLLTPQLVADLGIVLEIIENE